ncbi:MAG: glycine cleavage system aminomethyltransferase GcvT [Sphingomonadaceae bacterium]|uniref:glycine cleavage system aminomethyltransferase GcvT n=1 Tax=Thermaurantiacus sp. TaxID=2820283 RepID=UPI00298EEAD6|nr:glycine cleavage system aminomethyltransferase GcvT [Thermaurantiacus sp.]MCS6986583.1 glycine cleavage system aminomethyltransferase GcvT [Sphingomonadaceae bacterium]MDW8414156.1 glycine cleavage system aminomethyltransferase GcvT [Thermaurantiacus sp.]
MTEEDLKDVPLAAWHRGKGARMVPFAGHRLPLSYGDGILAEHHWTRTQASLFDVSHMGQFHLAGPGAAAWLERWCPGDFQGLQPGRMRYTLLLAEDGGILDDLMVMRLDDSLVLVVNAARRDADLAHLGARLTRGLSLTHLTERALLALQGPAAAGVVGRLGFMPDTPDTPPAPNLRFLAAGRYRWNGAPVVLTRSGYTGEDGFELSVPVELAQELAEALLSSPEVRPAGLGARDTLRLEAGLPLHGHDIGPDTEPVEAGLAFAISPRRRREGGFPGAQRILTVLKNGPARRRVGLRLDDRQPAREGAPILAEGEPVGRVTSGAFGPSVGSAIAMGYVCADRSEPGTRVKVEVRGRHLPATVVPLPFRPHRYVR